MLRMEKEASLIELGKRIKELRKANGLTQVQLAHTIGKDQQSIQMLEKGKFNPTYFYLKEVAEGLNTTVSEITKGL